jgi:hypothetical protein
MTEFPVQQQIVGRHKRKKSSTPAKLSRHDQKEEEGGARVWEGGSHTHHDTSKANEIAAK